MVVEKKKPRNEENKSESTQKKKATSREGIAAPRKSAGERGEYIWGKRSIAAQTLRI